MEPEKPTPQSNVQKIIRKVTSKKGLIISGIVILILFITGIIILTNHDNQPEQPKNTAQNISENSKSQDQTGAPTWTYNQEKLEWFVQSGKAPECKEPLALDMSPVDMSKITAVGLPGAYRGFSYKAHGGFRAKDETLGKVDVKMPIDATLTNITRYYESIPGQQPELQYLLSFENDCGIAFRFDHLYTLAPKLQALAEKTPAPKLNDTATTSGYTFEKVPLKAGDLVATEVGFPVAKNYGFDFGVYDYRKRNKISENSQWAAIHKLYSATEYHGVCWLPMLPGNDAAVAEAMAKDRNNYNMNRPFTLISDYCDFAPHKTLEFNNGQPTDD